MLREETCVEKREIERERVIEKKEIEIISKLISDIL